MLEVFNELVDKWNVTDHAGELCHIDEDHIHELSGMDNRSASVTYNMSSLGVDGDGSDFCKGLYNLTRELLLQLNYTDESCLMNGTRGDGDGGQTATPGRLDYATGTHTVHLHN